jgi:hypothetical protein
MKMLGLVNQDATAAARDDDKHRRMLECILLWNEFFIVIGFFRLPDYLAFG